VHQRQEDERLRQALELAESKKEKVVQEAVDQLKLQAQSKHLKALESSEQVRQRQEDKKLRQALELVES